ncbi:MAG: PLC-like phosphodiesterase [Piptocephalis tieghemiana]|nr:MAG: PLC-like phosphodiesterase [Piptocephalis tieghemiana]
MVHPSLLLLPVLLHLLPKLNIQDEEAHQISFYQDSSSLLPKGVFPTLDSLPPWIIAHRGSSSLHPEHTLEAYSLSAHLGAHWIEPDLVLTKDGVPVCRHDAILGETTDVASRPEFAHRRRNLTIPILGSQWTWKDEWAVEDFTLQELQSLRAIQRPNLGVRSDIYDGHFNIPTLEEVLVHYVKLAKLFPGQLLGIIPEIKHPAYFNQLMGHERYFEDKVLSLLDQYLDPSLHHIIIQSFYPDTLHYLQQSSGYNTLLLANTLTWRYMTLQGIQEVARISKYFGPMKEFLIGRGIQELLDKQSDFFPRPTPEELASLGGWVPPKDILPTLHDQGVRVVPFTASGVHEPLGVDEAQMVQWMQSGIDGLFCDDVSMARRGLSIASTS